MKEGNVILEKSFQLSLRIVKTFQLLRENKVERDICLQLLRSGTSIGANVEEAVGGSSKKDFINKLQIAYKEARETNYWLRLLKESNLIESNIAESLISDCEEILRILTAILNSSKVTNY
jgi:four helix bundle protein